MPAVLRHLVRGPGSGARADFEASGADHVHAEPAYRSSTPRADRGSLLHVLGRRSGSLRHVLAKRLGEGRRLVRTERGAVHAVLRTMVPRRGLDNFAPEHDRLTVPPRADASDDHSAAHAAARHDDCPTDDDHLGLDDSAIDDDANDDDGSCGRGAVLPRGCGRGKYVWHMLR